MAELMARTSSRTLMRALCLALAIVMDAGILAAQSFTAGVRGAVRESGAVVPGVTVQLVNEATGTARQTGTNAVGEYDFSAVPPGTYTVRAALQGFKGFERTGVRVATQQFVTVDIALEIGRDGSC